MIAESCRLFLPSQNSCQQQPCNASLQCFLTSSCLFSVFSAFSAPQRTAELAPNASYAQVLPDCLMGSKLLHQALGALLLAARRQLATSADALLLGVHVVSGALSLSCVRKLFPIDTPAKQVLPDWFTADDATL